MFSFQTLYVCRLFFFPLFVFVFVFPFIFLVIPMISFHACLLHFFHSSHLLLLTVLVSICDSILKMCLNSRGMGHPPSAPEPQEPTWTLQWLHCQVVWNRQPPSSVS